MNLSRSQGGLIALEVVQQSLTNTANGAEGGAFRKQLHEVLALLYAGAQLGIQRN